MSSTAHTLVISDEVTSCVVCFKSSADSNIIGLKVLQDV